MIQETNCKLREGNINNFVVGSLDVEALYPSIDQVQGPEIVAQEIIKSSLTFENVDEHLLGVYLAVTFGKERSVREGVWELLPKRKAEGTRGRKPTVHSQEI